MFRSVGFWRFEFAFQTTEWGLPFSFTNGVGAFSFYVLCLEFTCWRKDFRYDPRL